LQKAISDWEKGRVELRNDKGGNFHILLGKTSFELNQIEANYRTLFRKIMNLKPTN
jgi:large subunit ribosomal protein L1